MQVHGSGASHTFRLLPPSGSPDASATRSDTHEEGWETPAALPGTLPPAATTLTAAQAQALDPVRALTGRTWMQGVEDGRLEAKDRIREWSIRHDRARKAGVDLAKTTFVSKLLALGSAVVTLGIASALAVASAGAATPLVAIAAVRASVLVADCVCAYVDWKGSQASPPRTLPLGSNSLGNAVYYLARSCMRAPDAATLDDRALSLGRAVSGMAIVGMAAAGWLMTVPVAGFELASVIAGATTSGAGAASALARGATASRAEYHAGRANQAKADLFTLLATDVKRFFITPDGQLDRASFDAWCQESARELEAEPRAPDAATLEAFASLREGAWASAQDSGPSREGRDRKRMALDTGKDLSAVQRLFVLGQAGVYLGALDLALIGELV